MMICKIEITGITVREYVENERVLQQSEFIYSHSESPTYLQQYSHANFKLTLFNLFPHTVEYDLHFEKWVNFFDESQCHI